MEKPIPGLGGRAPDFSAPDQDGTVTTLQDFASKWLVLYFYPKDNTPGCTVEATDFSRLSPDFTGSGAVVVGVSPDSESSHRRFIEKRALAIRLLSDPEHRIAGDYGAWGLKKFMGKEYMGILRSTFLIAPGGTIAHLWRNVKTKGHAEAVLAKVREAVGEGIPD